MFLKVISKGSTMDGVLKYESVWNAPLSIARTWAVGNYTIDNNYILQFIGQKSQQK